MQRTTKFYVDDHIRSRFDLTEAPESVRLA